MKVSMRGHESGVNVVMGPEEAMHAIAAIVAEYVQAREKWPPMASAHEGYAILLEEVEELWQAVKLQNAVDCRKEAIQVGAMVLAFLVEVVPMMNEAQDLEGRAEQDALEGGADAMGEAVDRDRHAQEVAQAHDEAAMAGFGEPVF